MEVVCLLCAQLRAEHFCMSIGSTKLRLYQTCVLPNNLVSGSVSGPLPCLFASLTNIPICKNSLFQAPCVNNRQTIRSMFRSTHVPPEIFLFSFCAISDVRIASPVRFWSHQRQRYETRPVRAALAEAVPISSSQRQTDRQRYARTHARGHVGPTTATTHPTTTDGPTDGRTDRQINQRGSCEAVTTGLQVTTTPARQKIKRFAGTDVRGPSALKRINTIRSSLARRRLSASRSSYDDVATRRTQFRRRRRRRGCQLVTSHVDRRTARHRVPADTCRTGCYTYSTTISPPRQTMRRRNKPTDRQTDRQTYN